MNKAAVSRITHTMMSFSEISSKFARESMLLILC